MSSVANGEWFVAFTQHSGGKKERSRRWSRHRRSSFIALAEVIVLFTGLLAIDWLWFNGDMYTGVTPHPFWIPVVLLSTQYGIRGGLIASFFSTLLFIIFIAPPQTGVLDFYANATNRLLMPTQWFLCSLALGSIRSLQMIHIAMLTKEKNEAISAAEIVSDALDRAVSEIERLELCIAGETRTVSMILRCLSNLDIRGPVEMIKSFAPVIDYTLAGSSFTIFLAHGADLFPVAGMKNGAMRNLKASPKISEALIQILQACPFFFEPDDPVEGSLLPPGAICAVAISDQRKTKLYAVILLDGLSQMRDAVQTKNRLRQIAKLLAALLSRFEHPSKPRGNTSHP